MLFRSARPLPPLAHAVPTLPSPLLSRLLSYHPFTVAVAAAAAAACLSLPLSLATAGSSLAASQLRTLARAPIAVVAAAVATCPLPPALFPELNSEDSAGAPQSCGRRAWSLRVSALNHSGICQNHALFHCAGLNW